MILVHVGAARNSKNAMGNRAEVISNDLRTEGYDKVYIWDAEPNEEDAPHSHPYDVKLVVLEGELNVTLANQSLRLKPGDQQTIAANLSHTALAGQQGCRYIIGQKEEMV